MTYKILSIAGFKIKLQSASESDLAFDPGTLPFLLPGDAADPDVLIHCITGIPGNLMDEADLLFEARNPQMKYFSIFRHSEGLKFLVYTQTTANNVQQVALLNHDFSIWTVYSQPQDGADAVNPIQYPLGPLIFYYLTVKYDAIMIHASGIFDGVKGRLFSGVSGVGKSTMAGLWRQTGSQVINDDRLILRKHDETYIMYNTPMWYEAAPAKSVLNSIHLLKQTTSNSLTPLSGAAAVSRIFANCIQHGYKRGYIEHHLNFLSGLCSKLAVFETGFTPDRGIVDFIQHKNG